MDFVHKKKDVLRFSLFLNLVKYLEDDDRKGLMNLHIKSLIKKEGLIEYRSSQNNPPIALTVEEVGWGATQMAAPNSTLNKSDRGEYTLENAKKFNQEYWQRYKIKIHTTRN